jgi:TonB family protein
MNHLGPSLRRRPVRSWTGWRLLAGLLLSVGLNVLLLWLIHVDWVGVRGMKEDLRPVGMAPLSADRWAANRQVLDGSRPAPPPVPVRPQVVPRPPPEPPTVPGQVVDVAPTGNDKAPKDSRFLAESNNTVDKETISRFRKPGFEKTAPSPTQNQMKVQGPAPRGAEAAVAGQPGQPGGDTRRPGAPGTASQPKPARPEKDRVAMVTDPDGRLQAKPKAAEDPVAKSSAAEAPGLGGEGGQGAPLPGAGGKPILQPSAAFYDKLSSGPAPDHVEGVDVGDATFLNTREWKYAGFFNRVKQAVAEHWNPVGVARDRDPTGEKFFYKDRVTVLAVTINSQGAVTDLKVSRASGLEFLDQTALDAFQSAQPFLNPPPGLVDSHGEIKFTFGFHLEAAGGGMRFFRGASR